ncbi:hypothetical protein [Archangium sp.]|uniref:hypothetical protein n=1 Tax=Archangium sp. TaxID=1872627 RepID=UPI002D68F7B9|nr:hypothetical protein [Archangium sp.]HYO52687.1 hypothetical protein [Archangium sp.]
MSIRRVQVVVLCEGLKDYNFARRCLVRCGWRPDQIAPKVSPAGGGSGFTFVLNEYAAEVRANRNGKKARALLVLVDADTEPEGGREKSLDQRLRDADQKPRKAGERIALWVPKRQLETWIHFLLHGRADEETDYKREHGVRDPEYKPAAEQFAQLLEKRRSLPSKALPSLKKAAVEFERLRTSRSKRPTPTRS